MFIYQLGLGYATDYEVSLNADDMSVVMLNRGSFEDNAKAEKFTPDDLKISFEFYNIPIPDSHFIYNRKTNGFADFCNGQLNDNFDYRTFSRRAQSIEKIYIVKLTEDNKKDNELLNEVVDENYPVFYANETPILESEFQYYLKNKSNICGYWNKSFEVAKDIQKRFNCKVIFIGNFSDKEKEDWTYV